jgi:hypothetical protein
MTPKWTPGPWKVWAMQVCSAALAHGGDKKQMDDSDVVANTYQRDENGKYITCDAHLIAAAPELYSALEAFTDGTTRDWTNRMANARKALAKARGETDAG